VSRAEYEQRKQRLVASLRAGDGNGVRLQKSTSNLFRDRKAVRSRGLDVREFNHVLAVDTDAMTVDVEGMTPYDTLVAECLRHGVMPTVVPQLKSITIGGATTGCGIEATSFRYGLVHETVLETEILLADGSVVTCTPDNEHRDLFFGFPNSYGTLGYALRLKVRVIPVKPYVHVTHTRYEDPQACFRALAEACAGTSDFVDGVVFGPREMVISTARFVDKAPWTSDYTFENIYYRSLRERREDYLPVANYIWRWDTDWFWCSKNLLAQNPLVRRLLGRKRLNSVFYTRVMRWNARWGITRLLNRLLGRHTESVIQDVEIPITRAAEFLRFYFETVRFMPVWICPTRPFDPEARFTLYPMEPGTLFVNFGFWDVVTTREAHPPGHFNRLVEREVMRLGGHKSLYSDSYFTPEEFWSLYNREGYQALRAKYDPGGRFRDLYAKCVLRE